MKKKVLIILFSILGFITVAGGLVATYFIIEGNKAPVELEETEAQFTTTLLEAPKDGSLPTEHEPTDVIAYTLWYVANSKEFSVKTSGIADAGIAKQQIANERVVKNGEAMISTVSSGMVSVAAQRYFFKEEENKVLARGATKVKDAIATWDDKNDPECVTYKEMKKRYGWYPFQANGYIICDSTYLNKETISVLDNHDGTYYISFSLDPDGEKAPFWYRREIITSSGSTMIPIFSSIDITFKIDKNYRLLSQNIKEVYTVKSMGVEAKTSTDVLDEFSYDNVEFNQEYYNWFMKYRSLTPKADSLSDEMEVKKADIMTMIVSSLQTQNNEDLNLKLNVNLNDLINLDGVVALNINDLQNVRVKATLGDFFYEDYYNNTFYLRINDTKYKIDLSNLSINMDSELDVDKIVNDLNSGTIIENGNNIKITTSITLFGIDLNLFFDINNDDGIYSLNKATGNININGFDIDLSIEKTDLKVETEDYNSYSELDVNTLIDNITDIINNKELGINLDLDYKDISISANGDISFIDNLFMNLDLSIKYNNLDLSLNVIYDNDIIYISYKDINVSINKDDILDLVDLFSDSFEFNMDSILDLLKDYDVIEIISNINNLEINPTTNNTNLKLGYKDIDASIDVINRSVNKEFDKTKYSSLSPLFNLIKDNLTKDEAKALVDNIKDSIDKKEFNIDVDFLYKDIKGKLQGCISFKDDLFMNLDVTLNIKDKDIVLNVKYADNIIYVTYDDIKVSVKMDDVIYLVNLFTDLDINLDLESLFDSIDKLDLSGFDLDSVLSKLEVSDISVTDKISTIIKYSDIEVSLDLMSGTLNKEFDKESYNDLSKIINFVKDSLDKEEAKLLIDNIKDLIDKKEFAIDLNLEFNSLSAIINGCVSFKDNLFIDLDIELTFRNLDLTLNVKYDNDVIYITLDNMNLSVSKDSVLSIVDLILDNIDLDIDFIKLLNSNLDDLINLFNESGIDGILEEYKSTGSIDIKSIIDNFKYLDIVANNLHTNVSLSYSNINLDLTVSDVNISREFDKSKYIDLSNVIERIVSSLDSSDVDSIIDIVKDILGFAKEKQFNINLDLTVYDNNVKHLDINGYIQFFIYDNGRFDLEIKANITEYKEDLSVKMIHSIDIKLLSKEYFVANNITKYNEDYIFITYGTNPSSPNNLIRMFTPANDLLDVLGTFTQLLGIDLSFLSNYSTFDFTDIDATQIKNLFGGKLDLSKIKIDNIINSIDVNNSVLKLDLNLSELLDNSNQSTLFELSTLEDSTSKAYIKISDLYVKEDTKLDINDIRLLKDNVNIVLPSVDSSWYDISSIDELLAGLLVTASNKSYEISGEVTLKALGFIDALSIPFVVKVNVNDDGSFVLYAYLNYDKSLLASTMIHGKETSFYYSDGYIIIDTKYKGGFLNLQTIHESVKVTTEKFLSNIKYYIFDFGMRLSSTILNAMDSSGETDNNIDASLVLEDYSSSGKDYDITLNIGELTGISGMGSLSTTISLNEILYNNVKVDAVTSISSLSLDMFSVLEITLNDPISLTNVKEVDGNLVFTDVDMKEYINFINNYDYPVDEIHTY